MEKLDISDNFQAYVSKLSCKGEKIYFLSIFWWFSLVFILYFNQYIVCLEPYKLIILDINFDYFYFVADNEKKTYFSETDSEHNQTVSRLKEEGKWYTY